MISDDRGILMLPSAATERHSVRRKRGGVRHRKNSFFGADEKCDFAKVVKWLWSLVGTGVEAEFFRKNKNRVKRTVRYHFAGAVVAKWQDEK
jgi:hypothetical protein